MMGKLGCILAVGLLMAADTPRDEAARQDLERLAGQWRLTRYDVDGQPTSAEEMKAIHLVVMGDNSRFTRGKESRHGTYRLDATRTPRTIDIHLTDGPDQGKTMLGIYEIDGNTWRVCLASNFGTDRPRDFASRAGTVLEVWQRQE